MDAMTDWELCVLAENIAEVFSSKLATPIQVHHLHYANRSVLSLGKFGAMTLVEAATPTELAALGTAFLAGLRYEYPRLPANEPPFWHAEGWA